MTDVMVPSLGESVSEATVSTWFKKPGDAVKREALRKAGVPYIEVPEAFRSDDVAEQLKRILVPSRSGSGLDSKAPRPT